MSGVTSYQELMIEQARAAVVVTGAHHSSWNKRVELLPAEGGDVRGIAGWDGTIRYDEQRVTAPLREMFDRPGHPHDEETLKRYRDALKVVFHENVHLLAAAGTAHGMGHDAYRHAAVEVLEEGATEAYSYDHLDAYIEELGLEEIAPGISSVRQPRSYPQYVPAAETFANAVGRRTRLDGSEVMRRLAVVNAADKFQLVADLVYTCSELPGLVPEGERAGAVERIEAAMKRPFAQIHDYDAADPADVRMAALAGAEADRHAHKEVTALIQQWSGPTGRTSVGLGSEHNLGSEQGRPGQQPPGQDDGSPRPDEGGLAESRSPQERSGSRAAPEELAETMRLGLGGTKPIQSTQRLSGDRLGSRRQAGYPIDPQSPERGG